MKKSTKILLTASLVTTLTMTSTHAPSAKAEQTSGGSSVFNEMTQDSDGDGLKGINELDITNPQEIDSDKDGLNDGNEDTDKDGLTNLEEQSLGTNLVMADSDGDGLEDSEELKQYNTDPLSLIWMVTCLMTGWRFS